MDTPALRKARGAFFTPPEIARYIAAWAVRSGDDSVLEPSCGDAAFLLAAGERLRALGAGMFGGQLSGIEIHEGSAASARERLAARGLSGYVEVRDFFDADPRPAFDAVIGNPPYVRYQHFSGEARAKGLRAALELGVRLTGLASSWAAFTVHASSFLRPDGRLGLVLPGELLSVSYAAQVRRFLLRRFARVRLVVFEERVFPDVLEEVVLLLAEGSGGTPSFELRQVRNLAELTASDDPPWTGFTPAEGAKWTDALLPADALAPYRELVSGPSFARMLDWGETYLGAVTGNNDYFALTDARARELGLGPGELLPISPPGSRHLKGLAFTEAAWRALAEEGKRCHLFAPGADPSPAARRYIEAGERDGVHTAYKCRSRKPWWRVPLVGRPDLLFSYMNHDRPRWAANGAGVQVLNSLYGVRLREGLRPLGAELLPAACLNSLTLLGGEMLGRAYGGGLLKHEPREADAIPVPSPETLAAVADELRGLRGQISAATRSPGADTAVDIVDAVLLRRHLGLDAERVEWLRRARRVLFGRRAARGRSDVAVG
jgi:adenine-specific DNA-methyltransferase